MNPVDLTFCGMACIVSIFLGLAYLIGRKRFIFEHMILNDKNQCIHDKMRKLVKPCNSPESLYALDVSDIYFLKTPLSLNTVLKSKHPSPRGSFEVKYNLYSDYRARL